MDGGMDSHRNRRAPRLNRTACCDDVLLSGVAHRGPRAFWRAELVSCSVQQAD